jgi:HSP20 family protein
MAMATLIRRDRVGLEFPDLVRRFFEGDLDVTGMLRVEEFRDGETLVVRCEVPGIDPDKDVDLTVSDGILRITARREDRSENKDKERYRSEFRYGVFVREVMLPPGVQEKDIDASYQDGVLEVRIPTRGEQEEPRRIPIKRS